MRIAISFLAIVLAGLAGDVRGATNKTPGGVEFTYYDPSAFSVSLAGSFNNWTLGATPMTKDEEGTWRVVVPLAAGKYEYKFVVNGGTWTADPDNPNVVGDYGNSGLEIDSEGNPVLRGPAAAISNTAANARVMINGWFRGSYDTRKSTSGDPRWRLARPVHEMYVGVNPTIGSDVKGSVTMRLDSGVGNIKEVRADLYSGRLAFKSERFDVTAFHNEETAAFDDPLRVIGHQDLPGSPWREDIPFGRGAQGLTARLTLKGVTFGSLYANVYDDDIYNSAVRWVKGGSDTARYDNLGTDVLGVRAASEILGVALGATYLSRRNGWWASFELQKNRSPLLDAYKQQSGNQSTWFELGTEERFTAADARVEVAKGVFVFGEFAATSYDARWDAGNKVRKQGDQFADGPIDVPVGDEAGRSYKAGLDASAGGRSMRLAYSRARRDGMASLESFVTSWPHPLEDPDTPLHLLYGPAFRDRVFYKNVYVGINDVEQFVIFEYRDLPKRTTDALDLALSAEIRGVTLGLEFDTAKRVWDYAAGDSLSDDEVTWKRLMPSLGGTLLKERLTYGLFYEFTFDNLSARMPGLFDQRELVAKGDIKLAGNWSLYCNLRHARYTWHEVTESEGGSVGSAGADRKESFFNTHAALVWSPIPKVEVRLGYGLSPLSYRDTPVEGREVGRERWMSSYLWAYPPTLTLMDAERALKNLKMISLMGVISF